MSGVSRQAIREIAGPERQRLVWKLGRVTEIMVCPWSDFRKLERPGLQEMLQKMEELKEENCRSSELAERVLDYLYYSFRSEGQYDSNEVYQMKCDCHREIVRCTAMVARMEKLHEKRQETIRKNEQEFAQRRQELKEQCERDPVLRGGLSPDEGENSGTGRRHRLPNGYQPEKRRSGQPSADHPDGKTIHDQRPGGARGVQRKQALRSCDLVLKELYGREKSDGPCQCLNRAGISAQRSRAALEQKAQNALKEAASLF